MGQKNYAYRAIAKEGEITVCKVGGITLNYHTSQTVNFQVIKAMNMGLGVPVDNVHTESKMKHKRKAGGR